MSASAMPASCSPDRVASIARLLGVGRSTLDKHIPELGVGRRPAVEDSEQVKIGDSSKVDWRGAQGSRVQGGGEVRPSDQVLA
ncbi:MAG: hypothetical protein ACXV3F_15800, partial [Frankiaceae bacterium]